MEKPHRSAADVEAPDTYVYELMIDRYKPGAYALDAGLNDIKSLQGLAGPDRSE